jgi:predicted ATPase
VGRDQEFHTVVNRLDEAATGAGGAVLICGEAGIGKSRLLLETLRFAQSKGWKVLSGRAYESAGAPPYQPFIEALRSHLSDASSDVLQRQLGSGAAAVALVIPELMDRVPVSQSSPPGGPSSERQRLFDAITQFLLAIAADEETGLVISIDDLHWADDSTLLLLEHVARSLQQAKLLIVGTYRDSEVAGSLMRTLDLFTREGLAQTIGLRL